MCGPERRLPHIKKTPIYEVHFDKTTVNPLLPDELRRKLGQAQAASHDSY